MPELKRTQSSYTWKLQYEVNGLETAAVFTRFMKDLEALNHAVPLHSFDVKRDDEDVNLYSYEFVAKDGRSWTQNLRFSGQGVKQTFHVPEPGFFENEFALHRAVRNSVIDLVTVHRIYLIKCNWA